MPVHLCRKKNMFWSDNGQVNQRTKEYQHMGIYFFKVMKISDPAHIGTDFYFHTLKKIIQASVFAQFQS